MQVSPCLGPSPNLANNYPNPIILSSNDQTTVTLHTNGPPSANAGTNQQVKAGTPVIFNATQSISEGNDPTYTWTFLDGTEKTLTGIIANYTFNNTGTFPVELTVQDSIGSDSANVTIIVISASAKAPTIVISGNTNIVSNPITFSIDNSTLRNVPVQSYLWNVGVQQGPADNTEANVTWAYSTAGTYNVSVTITYTDGIQDLSSTTVTIGSPSPTSSSSSTSSTSNPDNTNSPNPNSTDNTQTTNGASSPLPTTVLGIIIAVTIFVLAGSVFWLRNKT